MSEGHSPLRLAATIALNELSNSNNRCRVTPLEYPLQTGARQLGRIVEHADGDARHGRRAEVQDRDENRCGQSFDRQDATRAFQSINQAGRAGDGATDRDGATTGAGQGRAGQAQAKKGCAQPGRMRMRMQIDQPALHCSTSACGHAIATVPSLSFHPSQLHKQPTFTIGAFCSGAWVFRVLFPLLSKASLMQTVSFASRPHRRLCHQPNPFIDTPMALLTPSQP